MFEWLGNNFAIERRQAKTNKILDFSMEVFIMGKKKNSIVSSEASNISLIGGLIPSERKGVFEQGYDKLGRPYQKKLDDKGFYTKEEILKDGTPKLTIKKLK